MARPKAWLVTWSTYGAWLPGDPRGFQTRRGRQYVPPPARYAGRDEQTYDARNFRALFEHACSLSSGALFLTRPQQRVALDATVERIRRMRSKVRPGLIVLGSWHVHLLARFPGANIRQAVGRYKQAASIALGAPPAPRPRWWADRCHMRSLAGREAVEAALAYLRGHVQQGDLHHSWLEPQSPRD